MILPNIVAFLFLASVAIAIVAGSPINRADNIVTIDGIPMLYDDLSQLFKPLNSTKDHSDSPVDPADYKENDSNELPDEYFREAKRSALRFAITRRSQISKDAGIAAEEPKLDKYIPALSVGAMLNLRAFFDGLKSNVDMLESKSVSPQEFRALSSLSHPVESFRAVSQYVDHIRPTANAAYLNGMRMYRPSNRVRALVAHHPETHRGVNNYKPSYLWTGLG